MTMNHLCECSCSETKLKVQSNNLESKEHKTTYKQPDQGRQQNKRDLDQPKNGRADHAQAGGTRSGTEKG